MPNSIYNIKEEPQIFHSSQSLQECIDAYFEFIKGEFEMRTVADKKTAEPAEEKIWLRHPEPPTFTGLAYYLGFNSVTAFEQYEAAGKYHRRIKRARLRIEAEYEKKLHGPNSAGAVFALKNMGWNEKSSVLPIINGAVKIEIINTGLEPAASETEVQL